MCVPAAGSRSTSVEAAIGVRFTVTIGVLNPSGKRQDGVPLRVIKRRREGRKTTPVAKAATGRANKK
jgi:hypothetical protein